jgi:hypothetical protein
MIHIGYGVADISPRDGMEMPGGFQPRYGKAGSEPLLAVACVLHDAKRTVALVGIDTVAVLKETVARARRRVEETTKIPGTHVLVGASHTHTGGPTVATAGSRPDPIYLEMLVEGIASAVGGAYRSMHEAEIGIGMGREDSIAFNRRFLMRDGREITHPGKPGTPHHREIVGAAGPADPDVGVLAARAPGGSILGVFVHFACHSTVISGERFTPDYAGYLRKHVKAHYGASTPVGFLLGACGDITQVDNLSTAVEFGPEHADMMGRKLAAEAVRTIGRMTWLKDAPLAATVEDVLLPIRPEPDPELEKPAFGLGSDWDGEYAKDRLVVAEMRAKASKVPCEVQALGIGPLGIATNGAEYFCEYGLRIKRCSPFKITWPVTLANDYIGYVATANGFVAGGYEPRTAQSSKMSIDTGQRLVESALRGLTKVSPSV